MRCFLALPLPHELRQTLLEFQQLFSSPSVRLVAPDAFHLTLFFLGDLAEGVVKKLSQHLHTVRFAPLSLRPARLGLLGGKETTKSSIFRYCLLRIASQPGRGC